MNRIRTGIMALLVLFVLVAPGIAQAKVVDQAGLFNASTISQLDQRISAIKSTYGRDVLIVTVPSLGGRTIPQVASSFINVPVEQISGVYIFIAKQEKKVDVAVGANTVNVIPPARKDEIKQQIISQFKGGSFDQGILAGMNAIETDFRTTAAAPNRSVVPVSNGAPVTPAEHRSSGGFSFLWLILIVVGVFVVINIIRSLARGASGGYGGGVPGSPGYGGGGYGGGYGAPGMGGGGGFMSSLLGGVGGALAGNWLYDKFSGRGESHSGYVDPSSAAYTGGQPAGGSDWTSPAAGTGWSNDGGSSWGTPDSGGGSWGGSSDSGFGSSFSDSGSGSGSWGGSDAGFGGSIDSGGGGGGGDWS